MSRVARVVLYAALHLWWLPIAALSGGVQHCLKTNPTGVRLFHPAFPLELLKPLSQQDVESIDKMKSAIGQGSDHSHFSAEYRKLPWFVLPRIGVPDLQTFPSTVEIEDILNKARHEGVIIWAYKLERPEKGCLLVNHWMKEVVILEEYSPEYGARGRRVGSGAPQVSAEDIIRWPPLALELELTENRWQPLSASDNLLRQTGVLGYLPEQMPTALWEVLVLLLASPTENKKVLEAFFDTGLSPRRGMLAYLKLLLKVEERVKAFDGIPEVRQIIEREINL